MNNEKELFVNEEEIILMHPTELFDEAKEIAQTTVNEKKFPFMLQYDVNQKDFLMFMLGMINAIVETDDKENYTISTQMNMTQLAFMKRLDCVERVKTDEGNNYSITDNTINSSQALQNQQEDESLENKEMSVDKNIIDETLEEPAKLAMNCMEDTDLEPMAIEEESPTDNVAAVASVAASARCLDNCCPCPTNGSMATAITIPDEGSTIGYIGCPGAEQWFKFVATRNGQHTIYTTGSLDTIGTLYDCHGNLIVEVDDYAPCGKINFRIIYNLTAGHTYYVKVAISKGDVGSYLLYVTKKVLADYVTINKDTIILEKGVTYELPVTRNYTYKSYNGAQRLPDLSVSISPTNATEQKVKWETDSDSVLQISSGWDNDGARYYHVTATETGTAKLYAQDDNENGEKDECTVIVNSPKKVTVFSCSPDSWIVSSEIMGRNMASEFNSGDSYVVKTPHNATTFETCWIDAGECIIIHTHGSSSSLNDHSESGTPLIISKTDISNLPANNAVHFILITACSTAGGTENDNVAYWLSKKINPDGIVIANTDVVSGGSTNFGGSNNNPTWKVYKDGVIQDAISDVTLTMQSAYSIYNSYK